jgi:hypothetical protein
MSKPNSALRTTKPTPPNLRAVDAHAADPDAAAATRVPQRLATRSGASAVLVESAEAERLEIRDASDRVLFELDVRTGRAIVRAPSGNLSLEAPDGDIELVARGSVRCRGETIEFAAEGDGATLVLGREVGRLTAKGLTLAAERADVLFGEARYVGARLDATLHETKLAAKRIERVAERLFERARTVFRKTEELDQLEAGRTRTIVEEGHLVRAGHASLVAKEEVTIDGERIHLG